MRSVSWIRNTLDIAGSHYKETHHPQTYTAQEMAQQEHVSGHQVAKTVAVKADDQYLLLVLPASVRVQFNKLREILGAKEARLLTEREVAFKFPDCEVGAIPPLRHWPGIEVWADNALMKNDEMLFYGGNHTDAIRMPVEEWLQIVNPKIADFSSGQQIRYMSDEWRDIQDAIREWETGQGD